MTEQNKKITLFALCMLLIAAGTADALELISAALLPVPGLGLVFYGISWFVGTMASFSIWLYLWLKGARHERFIAGAAAELLVGAIGFGFLPIRSATLIIMYIMDKRAGKGLLGKAIKVAAKA